MLLKNILLAGVAMLALVPGVEARELTLGMQDNEAPPVYKGAEKSVRVLAEVSGGELDIGGTGYPDMSNVIPALKLIGAPLVVSEFAQLKEIVDGPWGKTMADKFEEQGIHVLDVRHHGARQTTSNRPIHPMDDMMGLRLRTPNVPFLIAHAEATGATTAPAAFSELHLALQTNQADFLAGLMK